jgi:DNA-binding NarL/FixJ family response regulator
VVREHRLLTDPQSELAQLVREGNAMRPWFAPLTARQAHVGELVAVGLTNTEIARHIGISVRTTDAHVMSIFKKLDLHSRKQVSDWVLRSRPS